MTTFNTAQHPRGHASNPGSFSFRERQDGEPNLLTMPDMDEEFNEVLRIEIDGIDVIVANLEVTEPGAEQPEFEYKVYGDPLVGEFISEKVLTKAAITKLAVAAYNEARVANLKSRLGIVPSLDDALNTEIARLGRAQTTLLAPADWNGEYELTPAKKLSGERLFTDDCGARASYAEVGEDGITYGYEMNGSLLNEILVGDKLDSEDDSDYALRVYAASTADTWAIAEKFFKDEFGADLIDDGDLDLAAEFFVKYGTGGVKRACIEEMGERAESETKLLALRDSWEYGGSIQQDLAAKLGYRYERKNTPDDYFAGHYVKKEA